MYNQFFTIKPRISKKKRRKQSCTLNIYDKYIVCMVGTVEGTGGGPCLVAAAEIAEAAGAAATAAATAMGPRQLTPGDY